MALVGVGAEIEAGRAAWPEADPVPYLMPYTVGSMRKTSVYLDDAQADRLARLAVREGRSQAEILRDAIAAYEPPAAGDREFEVATGFARTDEDSRPVSQIPEPELLEGFGA